MVTGDLGSDAGALRRARVLLGLVVLAVGLHLVLGDKPWGEDGMAAAFDERGSGDWLATKNYVVTWSYWAACGTGLVAMVLLLTAPLWTRRAAGRPGPPALSLPDPRGIPRWLLVAIAAAMLAHAVLGLPRLSHSFWGDEAYAARTSIAGIPSFKDDHWRDPKLKWRETFHFYRKPNNHVPFGILARLSNETWAILTEPSERLRNEVAVRLPAFAAGLLAIAGAALLVLRLGHPGSAAAAAWLLALHPWLLRYSTEARGYSLLLALIPALWLATLRVLRTGTWPAWILFAACQTLVLWTYPAALFILAVTNLALLGLLFRGRRHEATRLREQLARYAVALTLSATAFLQVMAPNLAQFWSYVQTQQRGEVSMALARDLLAHLVVGVPWGRAGPGPARVDFQDLAAAHPVLMQATLWLVLAFALAGLLRLLRGGDARVGVAAALTLPLPLTWLQAWALGSHVYVWYMIFALPSLVVLAAIGTTWTTRWIGHPGVRRGLTTTLVVALLLGFSVATGPASRILRRAPIQPMRGSVEATRPTLDPGDPRNEAILTATIYEGSQYYDPRCLHVEDREHLFRLMERADAEGIPFFVVYGREGLARRRRPELVEIVQREDLFAKVTTLEGFFSHLSRHVFRYRPGSAAGATATRAGG